MIPEHRDSRLRGNDEIGVANRFIRDLTAIGFTAGRLGLAVSGGPDSVALLLLAQAALPGRIAAATVDHGLRPEAADEARFVAGLCADRNIPHATLTVTVSGRDGPQGNARAARYAALADWARGTGLTMVATAHHVDDQAETLLLRLARGAGLGGLSGARRSRPITPGVRLVRPLLSWRRTALSQVVAAAGIVPVSDPSNTDPRYDRTRARALLADAAWLDPARLAASTGHLAEAEEALYWAGERLANERVKDCWSREEGACFEIDVRGVPRELRRRLVLEAMAGLSEVEYHQDGMFTCTGPELSRFVDALGTGETRTVAGLIGQGGDVWRIRIAPPRARG